MALCCDAALTQSGLRTCHHVACSCRSADATEESDSIYSHSLHAGKCHTAHLNGAFPVLMLQGLDVQRDAGFVMEGQVVMAHGDRDALRRPLQCGICEAADVQHIAS